MSGEILNALIKKFLCWLRTFLGVNDITDQTTGDVRGTWLFNIPGMFVLAFKECSMSVPNLRMFRERSQNVVLLLFTFICLPVLGPLLLF